MRVCVKRQEVDDRPKQELLSANLKPRQPLARSGILDGPCSD